jgi:transposase InsO family protein
MEKTKEHKSFSNILNRDFRQDTPYKVFCTDITYLPFNGRLAYFSAVKDIASGELVGWNLSRHIGMEVVMDTLEHMKSTHGQSLENVLIHSDQGFHYTSPRYINMVKSFGMVQSMSRKGRCIDNAPMESFFGHLKDDVDYQDCKTFEELLMLITEYVRYYNNERQQWDLKKMTPVNYRNHLLTLQT